MHHDRRNRSVLHPEPKPEPPTWAKVVGLALIAPAVIVAALVVGKLLLIAARWAVS